MPECLDYHMNIKQANAVGTAVIRHIISRGQLSRMNTGNRLDFGAEEANWHSSVRNRTKRLRNSKTNERRH
jgi:hypothetical protein